MKLMLLIFLAGELRFALHDEPKTTDPLMSADESAEAIRYLNRLSDMLFILSRAANDGLAHGAELESESLWAPGAHGASPSGGAT